MVFSYGRPRLSSSSASNKAYRASSTSTAASSNPNIYIEERDVSRYTDHTYKIRFYDERIHTVVTHRASVVDNWISKIYKDFKNKLNKLVVGLDCEWMADFYNKEAEFDEKGKKIQNKVAVLQLCVAHSCLIFQFMWSDNIPSSLREFLNNEKFIFVGVGVYEDGYKLSKDYGLKVAKTVDLRKLAAEKFKRKELKEAGLHGLADTVLLQDLPKPRNVTLSKWDACFLTDEQIQYACLDAFVSFKLGDVLRKGFTGNLEHLFEYHRD
ncbi:hypothetical protein MKW94_018045 [Papaver nudicaule]|uniref:3'-5' exonuclease domain-containing protein n=1 Tax=Papaver nudicaule TaxID=74823 RepID=A0AA41S8Q0_PAPNU|nr:hypothetical protein [Papaver nudicaule]